MTCRIERPVGRESDRFDQAKPDIRDRCCLAGGRIYRPQLWTRENTIHDALGRNVQPSGTRYDVSIKLHGRDDGSVAHAEFDELIGTSIYRIGKTGLRGSKIAYVVIDAAETANLR